MKNGVVAPISWFKHLDAVVEICSTKSQICSAKSQICSAKFQICSSKSQICSAISSKISTQIAVAEMLARRDGGGAGAKELTRGRVAFFE